MIALDFSGRSVVITGGAAGIGRATALRCAEAGAHVTVADIDPDRVRDAVAEVRAGGGRADGAVLDVTDSSSVDRVIGEADPDDLVACAGVLVAGGAVETSDEDWRRQFAVNVDGLFACTRAFIDQRLRYAAAGRVVTVGSVGGLVGDPGYAAYCASKGAVLALTRQLAVDYAGRGIRVNAIAPGFTRTDMTGWHDADTAASFTRLIPRGRWAEPEEIADVIVFLLSDLAAHIHGQTVIVDGGRLAGTPHA